MQEKIDIIKVVVDITEEAMDWFAEEKEEKKMLQPKLENVLVATVGDDGTARLWYPLQVTQHNFTLHFFSP